MRNLRSSQEGAGIIALVLVMAVIVAVAVVGYRVVKLHDNTVASDNIPAHSVAYPVKITSKANLTQAANALQSSAINSSLDTSQLDADIQALY